MGNMKKNLFDGILKIALTTAAVLCGVQSAAAAEKACTGTAYIRVPSSWPDVYVQSYNASKISSTAYDAQSDYYVVDLSTVGEYSYFPYFSVYTTQDGDDIIFPGVRGINATSYNQIIKGRPEMSSSGLSSDTPSGIPCPGEGKSVYVMEDPLNPGTTYVGDVPSGAKYFHVLMPNNAEWLSDQVVLNYDGRDTVMAPDPNLCGWVTMVFEKAPSSVYLYRKNDPTAQLGLGGLPDAEAGKMATPIDLETFFDLFGTNELYFMPDEEDWLDGQTSGWSVVDPGVPEEGDWSRCSFSLAALIYDTDETLNPAFSSDGSPDLFGAAKGYASGCVGVHHGIVDVDLGVDGKPKFSGSANAVKCFANEGIFNSLFNYTPGVNEVQCYDMPFRHYGKDTRWGFDSDSMITNGLVGGFSPIEETTDMGVVTVNGVTMGPLAAARTKRSADGPVPTLPGIFPMKVGANVIEDFDHYCNTPGWSGGIDCEGLFDSGDNPADFWCWGSYCNANFKRWGYGSSDLPKTNYEKRNQQFCFQSHATFVYHEDQEFTFRGDDDIWVFINKKLAVDNGGVHLATPGHVVLKNLNTVYGAGFLMPDNTYDLDIFFCDRRTTMSNVIIKTNMYIQQKTAITLKRKRNEAGNLSYEMCYSASGDGSCASAIAGNDGGMELCGEDILNVAPVTYYLVKGNSFDANTATVLEAGKVNMGGIDLTNATSPKIVQDKLTLDAGSWGVYVSIMGKTERMLYFRVSEDGAFEENPGSSSNGSSDESSEGSSGNASNGDSNGATSGSSATGDKGDGSSATSSNSTAEDSAKSSSSKKGESDEDEEESQYAEPSFRVKMVGPFTFAIVFNETAESKPKSYVVTDMLGSVVKNGVATSNSATIVAPSKGSFIVRSGRHSEMVKFK